MKKEITTLGFGRLGSVTVLTLEEEQVDVYAKYTSSAGAFTCPDGTRVASGGPTRSDDSSPCPSGPMVTM